MRVVSAPIAAITAMRLLTVQSILSIGVPSGDVAASGVACRGVGVAVLPREASAVDGALHVEGEQQSVLELVGAVDQGPSWSGQRVRWRLEGVGVHVHDGTDPVDEERDRLTV